MILLFFFAPVGRFYLLVLGPARLHTPRLLFVRTKSNQKVARTKVLDSLLGAALWAAASAGDLRTAVQMKSCSASERASFLLHTGLGASVTAARLDWKVPAKGRGPKESFSGYRCAQPDNRRILQKNPPAQSVRQCWALTALFPICSCVMFFSIRSSFSLSANFGIISSKVLDTCVE